MQRFIRGEDFPQVLDIWQACFGDEEYYVRFFWENCFPMCRGLAREEDGKLAAMLFLLPGTLDGQLGVEYVYAVATLPDYRSKGYAAQLTRWAADIARSEGKAALCLCPGSESLYDYYGKQGFVTAFRRQDTGMGRFVWPPHMLDYMRRERALCGRVITEKDEPGGMLLALDARAEDWLRATKGQAYLKYNLE